MWNLRLSLERVDLFLQLQWPLTVVAVLDTFSIFAVSLDFADFSSSLSSFIIGVPMLVLLLKVSGASLIFRNLNQYL